MKKLLALLLAAIMVFALVACKPATPDATDPKPTDPVTTDPATEPAPTEPAELDPVTLKIWFHGSNVADDSAVLETINAYLGEKIAVTLEPIWGTWGDFDEATTTALAGGDDCDMYFTCNWSKNEYNKYAADGYWVRLDGESDLLNNYAPELVAAIPEGIWELAKTNGMDGRGIYAVPGLKDTATQNCWDVNATLLAELGYDIEALKTTGIDYYSEEFDAMMAKAKEVKGKDFFPLLIEPAVLERMVTNTSIITGDVANANVLSYYYDPAEPSKDLGSTIVNKYGTEEFAKFAAKTYEYAQKGYIAPQCQVAATANDYRTAAQNEANYLFGTQSYAFGCEIEFSATRKIDVVMIPAAEAYMDVTSGQGAMVAISTASKNPERAMMFLNLLNTDPFVMTTLNYGVDGVHFTTNDDGTITWTDEHANFGPWRNGMGNIRILPPTDKEGLTYWADFAAYYDAANENGLPCGAYIFDSSAFETEAAALANVCGAYAFNLMSGAVDPETELPKFLEELEAAGINEFVAAANEQLTAYLAG